MTTAPSDSSSRSTSTLPSQVGVLGGGRMGAGIAHAFAVNGSSVVVVDRDDPSIDGARQRVEKAVHQSVSRGLVPDEESVLARCTFSTDVGSFAGCGLVVEAVPEDLDLKVAALRSVEQVIAPGAALASNTSSLSLDTIAAQLERPSEFIGMHFFNPVPASTLVEIVSAATTSFELTERALGWVDALGKTGIRVVDSPGFASSRLGVAIALEAMRMVEEGVASAQDIDLAMELGYKHPSGPLKTTDIVGLDVRLGIAEYLESTLGPRFAPPKLLRDKVARGDLGRKTGRGFYDWKDGS